METFRVDYLYATFMSRYLGIEFFDSSL